MLYGSSVNSFRVSFNGNDINIYLSVLPHDFDAEEISGQTSSCWPHQVSCEMTYLGS